MSIRITETDRMFLRELASKTIQCKDEERAAVDAYVAALPIVRTLVMDRYPPKDMAVLEKYHATYEDRCIRIQLSSGGIVEFCIRKEDKPCVVPGNHHRDHGCQGRIYAAGPEATQLIQNALDAAEAREQARNKKLADYRALIAASTTLEQIEAVWPFGGEELRPRKGRALPVILSDEVVARIKADVAATEKEAA